MLRHGRLLIVIPAIATLLVLSFWSVRWGFGDSYANGVNRKLSVWMADRTPPSLELWLWARTRLQRAEALAPADPAVPELMGLLHLQQADRAEFSELALEHFQRALERRPSSPYTWANVVEARFRLGRTQPPFEQLLVQTQRLGPNEPETQRLMVEIGSAMWSEISPQTQLLVKASLEAAMRRNPLETLLISERRGRLDLSCPYASGDMRLMQTKWKTVCEELEES